VGGDEVDKIEIFVKEMLEVGYVNAVVDAAETTMDIAGSFTPIGSLWTGFKIHKLKKRLNAVEPDLLRIKKKIEQKENEVFYKQEVFPLILKLICEEDEDGKENIYINGFEYTVDEGIEEMEKVFHYFDVLAELRISDIVHLFKRFGSNKQIRLDKDFERYHNDSAYRKEYSEKIDLETYMMNKLVRLGIINIEQIDALKEINDSIGFGINGRRSREPRILLTNFGKRFIEFFKNK